MSNAEILSNAAEFTVSELALSLKNTVENAYGYVRLRGEVSGYRGPHSSGHVYFCLKDSSAKIDAVVWKGVFGRLKFKPEEGLEVIATGKLTTYPGSSKYQIVIDAIEPAGAGALMALLEARRKKLTTEGLFDAARKQLLPSLPRVIGVITSPTGAVIRDILHRIADRFPVHVIVWPVRVQGDTSAFEIAAAVNGFNAMDAEGPCLKPDLLIVARGGGSLEDLWSFNEENVVRAVAASDIPVISAVGHETDWTLIDFAADVRAPTPTAAAELALPVRQDMLAQVRQCNERGFMATQQRLQRVKETLRACARALPRPDAILNVPRQRLDHAGDKLQRSLGAHAQKERLKFTRAAQGLSLPVLRQRLIMLQKRVGHGSDNLRRSLGAHAQKERLKLTRTAQGLSLPALRQRLEARKDRAARLGQSFQTCLHTAMTRRRDKMGSLAQLLNSLSYKSILERGYAVIRAADGTVLPRKRVARQHSAFVIEFTDGMVKAVPSDDDARKKVS